ncbi:TPA: thioredoxin family protein [Enterococcus faecalis]
MNKKTVILLIIGFTAVSIGIACFLQFKDRTKELEVTVDPIALKINTITPNNLDGYLKKHKTAYVYFGRPDCSDCNEFDPNLIKSIDKYKVYDKLVYVNLIEVRKDKQLWEKFKQKYGIKYTPTLAKYEYDERKNKQKPKFIVQWTPENGTVLKDFDNFVSKIEK